MARPLRTRLNILADLAKVEKWGRANRVEFNARKTQCCLLSHKRISDPGRMGGMEIAKSETLDVWAHRYDLTVRWNDHVFNVAK